jgi:predicted dehydrogenase
MLRIAIVGCGKIADQHVAALARIPDCALVAVCDREPLMAQQLGERCGIKEYFSDATEMLARSSPDVVHITTPPQSHFSLGQQSLEAGCHVYVEKPFTVTADEAESLVQLAEQRKLKITAGHNLQFTLEMLKMRRLVKEGFLGDKVIHLESHFSYDLGDISYVAPLLGNRAHWVRQLPGQLLHNILSHGIAKLAEFLDDEIVGLSALAAQSPGLQSLGQEDILDELRVLWRDGRGTTAFFCFTTQVRPGINQLRIYGNANSIMVDHTSGTVIPYKARSAKSYLTFFLPPLHNAAAYFHNACSNIGNFLGRKLYQDSGMKELIARFYESIQTGGQPPIPYREIVLVARIMDEIFGKIYTQRQDEASALQVPLTR